jgi:hypothetical protein
VPLASGGGRIPGIPLVKSLGNRGKFLGLRKDNKGKTRVLEEAVGVLEPDMRAHLRSRKVAYKGVNWGDA